MGAWAGVRAHAHVVDAHKTLVHAAAQDVRDQVQGEDAVVVGCCSGVLACQIRVRIHKRGVC